MLIKILIVMAIIVVVLLIVVALQSSTFRIARSKTIAAPAAIVFDQVNDFHNWTWNPWGKIDPAMKQTYEGPPAGVGAVYTWSGNNEVGEGRMTIVESRPGERVKIRLDFLKPFAATHMAEFTFVPTGSDTNVTWTMYGDKNFMAKAIHLCMNMDKMIGGQFDKGLTDLKSASESAAAAKA